MFDRSAFLVPLLRARSLAADTAMVAMIEVNMSAQITKTNFTCQLVTIRSKKSFAEVTGEIERLFKR